MICSICEVLPNAVLSPPSNSHNLFTAVWAVTRWVSSPIPPNMHVPLKE